MHVATVNLRVRDDKRSEALSAIDGFIRRMHAVARLPDLPPDDRCRRQPVADARLRVGQPRGARRLPRVAGVPHPPGHADGPVATIRRSSSTRFSSVRGCCSARNRASAEGRALHVLTSSIPRQSAVTGGEPPLLAVAQLSPSRRPRNVTRSHDTPCEIGYWRPNRRVRLICGVASHETVQYIAVPDLCFRHGVFRTTRCGVNDE